MLLKNIYALLLLLFPCAAFAQNGTIKGIITDNDGNPAAYVSVKLKEQNMSVVTGRAGSFRLKGLPSLTDSLIITSVHFQRYSRAVTLDDNKTLDLGTIQLEPKVTELQSVEVNGRTSKSYKSDYSYFGDKTQSPTLLIPQSISAVTKQLIDDKMAFTLKDVVDDIAGVNVYSGYDEYTIRGFRAENAHDINGLRGYNSTYTSNMLVNIERVEVIKGPTASLYGNCDPGGTINFVTKKPLDTTRAELNMFYGSYDHYRTQGDLTGPLTKDKTLLYRFNAGYNKTKSFRDGVYGKSYELAPSLSYIPNDRFRVNADLSVSHTNTVLDRGQPGIDGDPNLNATPISLSVIQPGDYLHETDIATNITASYKITPNLVFTSGYLNYITKQNVAGHNVNDYLDDSSDSVSLSYTKYNYNTVTNTLTNYLTYKTKTRKVNHQLLAGFDYIKSKVDLNQNYYELPDEFGESSGIVGYFDLKNPQHIKRPVGSYQLSDFDSDDTDVDGDVYHTKGIYLQDQLSFDKWTVLLSVREEFYKGDDNSDSSGTGSLKENVFLPRVGIVYSIKPNMSVYAGYNRGFDPFEASTDAQVFDEPFKPIKSELYETGFKGNFFSNRLGTSLAVYQLTVENVATNAGDPSNPELFVQKGDDRSRGVEAEVNGNILPNLSASLSYTYAVTEHIKSTDPDDIGKPTINAPRNISGSYIKYTIPKGALKNFGLSVGHSAVSSRATLDDDVKLPGYFLLNGGAHYKYDHFKLALNVNNIFNKTYWLGAYDNVNKWPGMPRNYMLNLGYEF